MPYRYSIETCQDHPNKSTMYLFYPLSHVDMLSRYATEICNLRFSGYATTLSRSAHQCQASIPPLNASMELGAGGMRGQPVKIIWDFLYMGSLSLSLSLSPAKLYFSGPFVL